MIEKKSEKEKVKKLISFWFVCLLVVVFFGFSLIVCENLDKDVLIGGGHPYIYI